MDKVMEMIIDNFRAAGTFPPKQKKIEVIYIPTGEMCWIPDVVNSDPLELDDDPSGLQQDYGRSE